MKIRHWLAFPLLALSANCSAPDDSAHPREVGQLGQALFAAAHEADVAEPLLYAITSIEDGFDEPLHRSPDPNAEAPQAGPFHLRHGKLDSLEAAARIAGVSELALREDTALAARAGAKLLAEVLARHGASVPFAAVAAPDSVEWASVKAALAEWSGYSDSWHQSDYATRVLGVLARGGEYRNEQGELFTFDAMPVPPALLVGEPKPVELLALVAELEGAELFPMNPNVTGKFLAGRDGYSVDTLIVHDTEGGWEGAVSTFQNQGSTSVHYLIGKDGRLAQFMPEADTGYHCGNRIYNRRSIGVEHVGFAHLPFPEAQYAKSAIVFAKLAAKYGIPTDRSHIIGHDQVPSSVKPAQVAVDGPPCMLSPKECQNLTYYGGASGHTDPGVWQWGPYMHRMGAKAKCNDMPSSLSCDSTGNYVFGCIYGDVRVQRCTGGCKPGEGGAAPTCEGPVEEAPDPGPLDAGIVPTEEPDPVPGPQQPPPPTGDLDDGLVRYDPPPAAPPVQAPPAEGGCAVGRAGTTDAPSSFVGFGLAGLLLVVSRGRSARRSPRTCA